jgi:drug/metabolite transporter (DMT)-like permease
MNALLFVATVLIWGSTWIAIAMQVGPVPVLVSVFYRFAVAALVLLAGLALAGRLRLPGARDWPWIGAQALCLFGMNFICFYSAAAYLPSGVISVIFSLATLFNAVNARIFFGERIAPRAVLASILGVSGLALLLGPQAAGASGAMGAGTIRGIGLACLGTMLFSLGNMVSRRNSAAGISPLQANGWGMACGALYLSALIALTGTPMVAPPDARFLWAMLYLAVVGSVIGFTTYLMMVARIGSARAAYATVLFPIVALLLSTAYEGYAWHWQAVVGLGLALAGNLVMFSRPRAGRAVPA